MLTADQRQDFARQGWLVLPGFVPPATCAALQDRAWAWVDAAESPAPALFSSREPSRTSDAELIASATEVRCFFETGALGEDGRLDRPRRLAVNKIGHALHDRDPVFGALYRDPRLASICADLGLARPLLWQSQVIFKPPSIGGEVRWHQDASFFDTDPASCLAFWFALDDSRRDNGCLWVQPGGHRGPLRERFVRDGDRLSMEALDDTPWPGPGDGVPLEVPAGTLVVFDGLLPHGSAANRSASARMACTLHVTDGAARYSARNWLQRPATDPATGFAPPGAPGG